MVRGVHLKGKHVFPRHPAADDRCSRRSVCAPHPCGPLIGAHANLLH